MVFFIKKGYTTVAKGVHDCRRRFFKRDRYQLLDTSKNSILLILLILLIGLAPA